MRMRTIRLIEATDKWPYQRHSPAGDGVWGDTQFYFGRGLRRTDWLVVISKFRRTLRHPRNRTIFLAGEPVTYWPFRPDFTAQFGTVVSTDDNVFHPDLRHTTPALPWHAGVDQTRPRQPQSVLQYADLERAPAKTKLCACICSNKDYTDGHRRRLAFVEQLRATFGDRIDFYGRGFKSMTDKAEALDAYRYHIVIENSTIPHYWTEKLADAFLRNCYPIYSGAPNIADYFDPAAMTSFDIERPDEAIATIGTLLSSDTDVQAAPAIENAKRLVLTRYNVLAQVAELAAELEKLHPVPDRPTLMRSETGLARIAGRKRRWPWARGEPAA